MMSIKLQTDTDFLVEFLDLLNSGRINAVDPDDKEAFGAVFKMYLKISDILDGRSPSDAFQVSRKKGAKKQPHTLPLAILIHYHKYEIGENWEVVEREALKWLDDRGLPPMTQAGLKKVYKRNLKDVEVIAERFRLFMQSKSRTMKHEKDT